MNLHRLVAPDALAVGGDLVDDREENVHADVTPVLATAGEAVALGATIEVAEEP